MKHRQFKRNFIIISAAFIGGLIFAYTTRLITFYFKENKKDDDTQVSSNYFNDFLENTINVTDTNGGLYLDGDEYIYKYNATDNYLWYSGELWRILKINDDKTITLVSNEAISFMQPKYDENNYLDKFLNEFYEKLDPEFLVEKEYCVDQITDLKHITCDKKEIKKISTMDLNFYNLTGNSKGFLNDGTSYLLVNTNEDNNYFYITNEGSVGVTSNLAYNLKVVVTIKKEINLVKGTGLIKDPYIISDKKITSINDAFVGEYIKYNNLLLRIINKNESSISALSLECLKENDLCVTKTFGYNINYLNSSIYKYLNNTFYNNLENKEFLIQDNFYVGNYIDYNYESLKEKEVKAYIGLPKIAEYFNTNAKDSYLITPNLIETVYTINGDGNYYLVKPTNYKYIYPVFNFDKNLKLTGMGTINDPYVLEGEVNE